jgi:hypothetical protein
LGKHGLVIQLSDISVSLFCSEDGFLAAVLQPSTFPVFDTSEIEAQLTFHRKMHLNMLLVTRAVEQKPSIVQRTRRDEVLTAVFASLIGFKPGLKLRIKSMSSASS